MAQHPDKVLLTISADYKITPRTAALVALAEAPSPTATVLVDVLEHRVSPTFREVERILADDREPLEQFVARVASKAFGRLDTDYWVHSARSEWPLIRAELVEAAAAAIAAIEFIDQVTPGQSEGGE